MTTTTVCTQKELDKALHDGADHIIIRSERGVWLHLSDTGSATVRASGSATVEAWDSATVRASAYVAVHLHSALATVKGGVIIDITKLDLTDPQTWCDYHGVEIHDGKTVLIKVVDKDLIAGHRYRPTTYPVGETVTAPDWDPRPECGSGLHLTPSAGMSRDYLSVEHRPGRVLECEVDVASMVCLGDKVKVPSLRVLREVTR